MSATQDPRPGYGFIYVLSNPSMRDIYKIGLTTNNVRQRIAELNTTGIPKRYVAEKIFEVEQRFLSMVESSAHKKLKYKNMHHGKEFFQGGLSDCVQAVEDAIFEITKDRSEELIGKAAQRAAEESIRQEVAQRKHDAMMARLSKTDKIVDQNREKYKAEMLNNRSYFDRAINNEMVRGLAFVVLTCIAAVAYPIGLIAWPFVLYFLYRMVKKRNRDYDNILNAAAASQYPYFNLENFNEESRRT